MHNQLIHNPKYQKMMNAQADFKRALSEIIDIDHSCITPTNGATGALNAIFSATSSYKQTGKALYWSIEYFDAKFMLSLFNFDLHPVENDTFVYPTKEIINSLKKLSPELLYISLPNNPCGFLLPEEELYEILDSTPKETRIVIDNTLLHKNKYLNISLLKNKYSNKDIIVVNSFSKSHGLVEERVGYMVAFQIETTQSIHPYSHMPTISAMKKASSMLSDQTMTKKALENIKLSTQILSEWNNNQPKITYHASNTNFACIELSSMSGEECKQKLAQKEIFVRSGKDLHTIDTYVRIDMERPNLIPLFTKEMDSLLSEHNNQ